MTDLVRRFIFEKRPVRGHWVNLEGAWRDLRAHADYPPAVRELLGQAVAASVLLAATLKFRGTLTFQLQGDGAAYLLVAQCTHDFRLRAVAHFDAEAVRGIEADTRRGAVFRQLVGADGKITVTIEADEKSMRYQGVVPLTGTSLSESLESYFATSEQLPTRVLLAADDTRAAGLLVQRLPDAAADTDTSEDVVSVWEVAGRGIESVGGAALLHTPVEELLAQGFPGTDLRLFRGAPVLFECRCSCGRVAGLLRALGEDEVRDVLKEQGAVTVTCEFCSRPYRFSASDVETLFTEGQADGSAAIH
ncbi:MAG: Hsp33 family molecular chaperone HslO [Steroidobacterales bacterium]